MLKGKLVVQDEIEEGTVNFQSPFVFNEAQFPKPIHEETDSRPGRADHVGQRLLADLRNEKVHVVAFIPIVGQRQKNPGQPLLA